MMRNNYEETSWQFKFFRDRLLMRVFFSLRDKPKSAKEICQESNISIHVVYSRIKKLKQKGLLERTGRLSDKGYRTFLYKS